MPTPTVLADVDSFRRFVHDHPLGVVATVTPDARPQAALVELAAAPDGDLLFNSAVGARKIANLASSDRVALVIGCDGEVSLQVEGTAEVVTDAARDAAARVYAEQFPGARTSDPSFVMVRVRPEWIRRYDVGTTPVTIAEGRPGWATDSGAS